VVQLSIAEIGDIAFVFGNLSFVVGFRFSSASERRR